MVNVAILGFGTVGSGVAEVLTKNGGLIDQRVDDLVRLKYILDVRDFPDSPYADCFVKDFSVIEQDPEVNIVVETIGGATIALDFTTRALKAGKSVVTSNKELVATHGYDLLQLARENGVSYLFEASVGGGIPILRPLTSCLAANELTQITGILNGTTNYILTRMIKAGLTFEQALKEAQIEANKKVDEAAKELDAALNAANQAYGNASIQCSLDFGRPLATYKYVSCYFGGNGHRGTDYAAPGGTEIYAVSGGVVTAAAYHYSWGYYVQVYHGKDDNGNSYSTLYAHMNSAPIVSVGQNVSKGQTLGYVGSTGNSTGNHLHLEMKVNNVLVNVMNYLS